MIDPQLLRKSPQTVADNLQRRLYDLPINALETLENRRKAVQSRSEALRAERNEKSRQIGDIKRHGGDACALIHEVENTKTELAQLEVDLGEIQQRLKEMSLNFPNLLHKSVPDGGGEDDNLEVRRWRTPAHFDFTPLDHATLGEQLQMMDFALAARLTATRFTVMRDDLARLHRALIQFMLNLHVCEHGYREMYMPYLANADTLTGTGQLPKFESDLFYAERDGLYLIPTAEVVLTNIIRDSIIDRGDLPLQLVSHTPCFRREAGSYGRDTRGMLRQHQFEKVELVHITAPEDSYDALEQLTRNAEAVLQRLELPYRTVSLCGGDIGFAAAKTYDIEVWLPGQNAYREISSCSNCEAFQARRMRARLRDDGDIRHPHTLNGSGVAVGRAMIAVMENYQQRDGSIVVPDALRPYMNGAEKITAVS